MNERSLYEVEVHSHGYIGYMCGIVTKDIIPSHIETFCLHHN